MTVVDGRNYKRNTILGLAKTKKPFIIRGTCIATPNVGYITYGDIRPYVPYGWSTNVICDHINVKEMYWEANPLWIPPCGDTRHVNGGELMRRLIPQKNLWKILQERPSLYTEVLNEFRNKNVEGGVISGKGI